MAIYSADLPMTKIFRGQGCVNKYEQDTPVPEGMEVASNALAADTLPERTDWVGTCTKHTKSPI